MQHNHPLIHASEMKQLRNERKFKDQQHAKRMEQHRKEMQEDADFANQILDDLSLGIENAVKQDKPVSKSPIKINDTTTLYF